VRHPARVVAVTCAAGALSLAGCANDHSALDPKGTHARDISNLWWLLFGISAVVFAVVLMLVVLGVVRRRGLDRDTTDEPGGHSALVTWGGVVIPTVVLVGTFVAVMFTLDAVSSKPGHGRGVTVDVVGRQWFWDVRYPDAAVTTANEIHIPTGEPVTVRVTSDDVIHSFWVPPLDRKIDAIPGRTNSITMNADRSGTYRGMCAEFCGLQHAHMGLLVVAEPRAQFDSWLQQQSQNAASPESAAAIRGQQVFLGSCDYCHTVRGTNASGRIGPDLTHLESRQTIAAATIDNTRGNLAGWLLDSQRIKPGNRMPPLDLSGPDLQDLLAYLEGLR
jgi:cytochrome c oxidase subunit 2